MIPYATQDITEADIKAVKKILKSDWLTQGPTVEKFEKAVTTYSGSKFATAVNSATSALHIACLALGLKKGDLVWTTPNTFVSTSNSAIFCGAKVDFIDIDTKTFNMSISELKTKLKHAKKINKLPKILIPVHFAGQPCEMKEIYYLSKKYNFKIIEDASHAIGSSYITANKKKGKIHHHIKTGSCRYSDITVFSFHPVKIITTGEGGMATTNSKSINAKLKLYRSHGITRNKKEMTSTPDGPWYYQQIDLGFNYRMNDIQAALGCKQIERIDNYIKKRHKIAHYYNRNLQKLPINLPFQIDHVYTAYHLYVITLHKKLNPKEHLRIFKKLRKKGIGVNLHYIPVHTHPFYLKMGFKIGDFPNSEDYYKRAISLPMYPSLSRKDQDFVIKCVKDCFQ